MSNNIEAMHRIFREQHRQMIEEQKKLLDDYKQYFDGLLKQMEAQEKEAAPVQNEEENVVKEIAEISALLDDAVIVYGNELAEILLQLKERQSRRLDIET
jgi:sugar-specific transcriptional regulator TrmB